MAHVRHLSSTGVKLLLTAMMVSVTKVIPTNIENHLMTHPAVRDAAVVGLTCDVDGEIPMAFVVKNSSPDVTADELVQYIQGFNHSLRFGIIYFWNII